MTHNLSLRITQHLTLTPQLQQAIRLLQISTLELHQEVAHMLDDNPFLEQVQEQASAEELEALRVDALEVSTNWQMQNITDTAAPEVAHSEEEIYSLPDAPLDWEGDDSVQMFNDDTPWGANTTAANRLDSDEEKDAGELTHAQESLQNHLRQQVFSLRLAPQEHVALHFLIDSLNEDGYLEDSLDTLAQALLGEAVTQASLQEWMQHFTLAMHLLHNLEPTGVGARNLTECLRLQLQAMGRELPTHTAAKDYPHVVACALRVCEQSVDLLARRDCKRLAQLCGNTEIQVRAALALIARLEPKPGRRFVDVQHHTVVPDVVVSIVHASGSSAQPQLKVQLNPEVMPRLRVQEMYASALRSQRGASHASGHAALQQRVQEARWFIKNIQQRFDTILRVSQAIVRRQKNFFLSGDVAMHPLVLREIAQELDLHESTLSRVTTAKYVATPFGTFELKHFFASGLETASGAHTSSTAVRARIKQMVHAENPQKPLSDGQIADLLKEQGIACARRTVAKYREALKIAPASLRRQ